LVTADTRLEVDEKLERLNSNIERLIAALGRSEAICVAAQS
jgi:hypothetical protein